MKNKLLAIGFAVVIAAGMWLPGLSYAQTATAANLGITPGMSDQQIITILVQVVQTLMQQIQTIIAKQAQTGQGQTGISAVTSTVVNPTTPVSSSTQPVITVTYPQAGYSLDNSGGKDSGLIANIQWVSSLPATSGVTIDLLSSNGSLKNIASNIANVGTYAWRYDSSIANGTYQIMMYPGAEVRGIGASVPSNAGYSGYFTLSGNGVSTTSTQPVSTSSAACAGPTQDIVTGPLGNPNGTGPFEQLDLATSTHPEILQYRIQWVAGSWSPWYVPGVNDLDWKNNLDGTARRIWSYFDDHTHEYINCPSNGVTTSTQSSITITSPNGQAWQWGTNQTITWTDSAYASGVYYTIFAVRSDGGAYGIIANQVYGTSYSWQVGTLSDGSSLSPLAAGESSYYIQIVRQTLPHAYSSNSPFSVTNGPSQQPSITLYAPSGGGTYNTGSNLYIQWLAYGLSVVNANLLPVPANGNQYGIFSSLNAGNNSYNWTIPNNIPAGTYQVSIGYGSANALSGTFTIAADTTSTQPVSLNVSLDPISPISTTVHVGDTKVTFTTIRLSASGGNVSLSSLQVDSDSPNAGTNFNNLQLWDGSTLLGTVPTLSPVKASGYPGGVFNFSSPLVISNYAYKTLTITVNVVNNVAGAGTLAAYGRFGVDGYGVGSNVNVTGTPYGNPMTIYPAQPSITVTSPSGGTYNVGSNLYIQWSATGLSTVLANLVSSPPNGSQYPIFSNLNAGINSYNWTIPANIAAGTYKVLVGDGQMNALSGQITITSGSTGIPAIPGSPNLSATGPTSVSVSWPAVAGASTYHVSRNPPNVDINTVSGTSFTDGGSYGMTCGTTYQYRVEACNSANQCSAWGSWASVTPSCTATSTAPTSTLSASALQAMQESLNSIAAQVQQLINHSQ